MGIILLFLTAGLAFAAVDTTLPSNGMPIEIIAPNGGEHFFIGDTMSIVWHAADSIVMSVNVKFSPDNGRSWYLLNTNGSVLLDDTNWERFLWVIPDTMHAWQTGDAVAERITISQQCFIRVTEFYNAVFDMSDAPFAVYPAPPTPEILNDSTLPNNGKYVELLSPSGGEVFHVGDTMHIRWHAVDSIAESIELMITPDNGMSWHILPPLIGPIGLYSDSWEHFVWIVPQAIQGKTIISETCRMQASDFMWGYGGSDSLRDMSETFSIRMPENEGSAAPVFASQYPLVKILQLQAGRLVFSRLLRDGSILTLLDSRGRVILNTLIEGESIELPASSAANIVLWRVSSAEFSCTGKLVVR